MMVVDKVLSNSIKSSFLGNLIKHKQMERCHWSKWLCCLHTSKSPWRASDRYKSDTGWQGRLLILRLTIRSCFFKLVSQIENFTACLRGMNIFVFGKFPYSTGCPYRTLSLLYMAFYAAQQTGFSAVQ